MNVKSLLSKRKIKTIVSLMKIAMSLIFMCIYFLCFFLWIVRLKSRASLDTPWTAPSLGLALRMRRTRTTLWSCTRGAPGSQQERPGRSQRGGASLSGVLVRPGPQGGAGQAVAGKHVIRFPGWQCIAVAWPVARPTTRAQPSAQPAQTAWSTAKVRRA